MNDLLDTSVWLPLSVPDHVHHVRALHYWNAEAGEKRVFCRQTALSFLRHLTNSSILGKRALDSAPAWQTLSAWLALPQVRLIDEPEQIDEWLGRWAKEHNLQTGHWTDAYLAAFAAASDCRLVAFDSDFRRYQGINFLHLQM